MLKWLWLSVAIIILDQLTKLWANTSLDYGMPVAIMPMFNLTLVYNTGAAFSFLSEAGGWQRWFFTGVAIIISVVLVIWLSRLKPGQTLLALGLALLLGGALGNLWDRLLLGHVIDFIDVYYGQRHWPAFNIADMAISIGAALMIFDSFRQTNAEKP
ncbi:MAG: signal peptidase II [Chromatiales bacterium]|nr:signal peptidase II [Chromatiales bacterium]